MWILCGIACLPVLACRYLLAVPTYFTYLQLDEREQQRALSADRSSGTEEEGGTAEAKLSKSSTPDISR